MPSIIFRYSRVLNGVAIEATRSQIDRIRGLDYVRSVRIESILSITDIDTRSIVAADRVEREFGLTGKGIRLAIIDTGIDYMHPDLGGGFGPAFRVKNGFDFVNMDDDPMDDNGHGTHVGGIAAGSSSTVPGIAPEVDLLAVKVLNADGLGPESQIIAGIEFAVDPDGDPLTDDGADVINMSLGGTGNADDPVARAVDVAVASGVVCVVSAGNSGAYQAIASPGVARRALTVGATDNDDRITGFSSKGPAFTTLAVKPELVAPGVQVNAARLGGGYRRLSGTSMSSPHVAGAAALLRQYRPAWTPDDIKAVLTATADDIGFDPWAQGSGRLNVFGAITAEARLSASGLNFGEIDATVDSWTSEKTFDIISESSESLAVEMSVGSLPPGLNLVLEPATFTLDPGERVAVTARITVTNMLVPFGGLPPETGGVVTATAGQTRLRLPFASVKANALSVSLDRDPLYVVIVSSDRAQILIPGEQSKTIIPPGTYTVLALFQTEGSGLSPGTRVIVERRNVAVNGQTSISMSSTEASNLVEFGFVSEDNMPLVPSFDVEAVTNSSASFSLVLLDDPSYDRVAFSPDAGDIRVDHIVRVDDSTGKDAYIIPLSVSPGSGRQTNNPKTFRSLRFAVAPTSRTGQLETVDVFVHDDGQEVSLVDRRGEGTPLDGDGNRTVMLGQPIDTLFSFKTFRMDTYVVQVGRTPDLLGKDNLLDTGGSLRQIGSRLELARGAFSNSVHTIDVGDVVIPYGGLAPYWRAEILEFVFDRIYFSRPPFFFSPFQDARNTISRFQLVSDDGEAGLADGLIFNYSEGGLQDNLMFSPGSHDLIWFFNGYEIDRLVGQATARLRFDTTLQSRQPGNIRFFAVLADGIPTAIIESGHTNTLTFEAQFDDAVATAGFRRFGTRSWTPLSLASAGGKHRTAQIPDTLSDGYYSVRISIRDVEGGSLDYQLKPAFRWGRKDVAANQAPGNFALQQPADGDVVSSSPGQPIQFVWQRSMDPDPEDVLQYSLRVQGPGIDTTLVIAGSHRVTLDQTDGFISGASYDWIVFATDGWLKAPVPQSFSFVMGGRATDTDTQSDPPLPTTLMAGYPNPFERELILEYRLSLPGDMTAELIDLTGRTRKRYQEAIRAPGVYRVRLQTDGLPSGVYLLRVHLGERRFTRKLVHLR